MILKDIQNVEINSDVAKLYEAIHSIKGNADDSKYEQKVCEYYSNKFNSVLRGWNYNFSKLGAVDLKKYDQIETVYKNLNELSIVSKLIDEKIHKKADFTKMETFLDKSKQITTQDYFENLQAIKNNLNILPEKSASVGSSYNATPLRLIEEKHNTDFSFTIEDKDLIEACIYLRVLSDYQRPEYTFSVRELNIPSLNASRKAAEKERKNRFRGPVYNGLDSYDLTCLEDNTRSVSSYYSELIRLVALENGYDSNKESKQLELALKIASKTTAKKSTAVYSAYAVLDEFRKTYNELLGRFLYQKRSEMKVKNNSFIIGLVCWVVITAAIVVPFLIFKRDIIDFILSWSFFKPEGAVFWKSLLYNFIFLIVCLIYAFISLILNAGEELDAMDDDIKERICSFPILPKGLLSFLIFDLTFLTDYNGTNIDRVKVPLIIMGVIALLNSLIAEFGCPSAKISELFKTDHRGLSLYSGVNAIFGFLFMVTFIFNCSICNVVLVWIFVILTALICLAGIVFTIMSRFDI